jgi:hypothetical protein
VGDVGFRTEELLLGYRLYPWNAEGSERPGPRNHPPTTRFQRTHSVGKPHSPSTCVRPRWFQLTRLIFQDNCEDRYFDLPIIIRCQLTSPHWIGAAARAHVALHNMEEQPKPPRPRREKQSRCQYQIEGKMGDPVQLFSPSLSLRMFLCLCSPVRSDEETANSSTTPTVGETEIRCFPQWDGCGRFFPCSFLLQYLCGEGDPQARSRFAQIANFR